MTNKASTPAEARAQNLNRIKTPQELARQARQLWDDLNESFTPDMAALRRGSGQENLRLGHLHYLFDGIHQRLTEKVFEFEYTRSTSTEEYMQCRSARLFSSSSSSHSSAEAVSAGTAQPTAGTSASVAGDSSSSSCSSYSSPAESDSEWGKAFIKAGITWEMGPPVARDQYGLVYTTIIGDLVDIMKFIDEGKHVIFRRKPQLELHKKKHLLYTRLTVYPSKPE